MPCTLPPQVAERLKQAAKLHQRTSSDYKKCLEFNQLMGQLLDQLEDNGCDRAAGKVMGILLECNPKEGTSCDKATQVGNRVAKLVDET